MSTLIHPAALPVTNLSVPLVKTTVRSLIDVISVVEPFVTRVIGNQISAPLVTTSYAITVYHIVIIK